jgi:hypothetical protein
VRDALLVIDVVQRFDHEDGEALLASLRRRLPGLRAAIDRARSDELRSSRRPSPDPEATCSVRSRRSRARRSC